MWLLLRDEYPTLRRDQVGAWLETQKLYQLYKPTKISRGYASFTPVFPLQSCSVDLIDFQNKPSFGNYRYILVLIDNFSRFMWARAMKDKTSVRMNYGTPAAMRSILEEIRGYYGADNFPSYILGDDGSEFKGMYMKLLAEYKIRKKRTIAGQPQSNGMVERANGKLKQILSKHVRMYGGDWHSNLKNAVKIYNTYINRSTKFTPEDAIELVLPLTKY